MESAALAHICSASIVGCACCVPSLTRQPQNFLYISLSAKNEAQRRWMLQEAWRLENSSLLQYQMIMPGLICRFQFLWGKSQLLCFTHGQVLNSDLFDTVRLRVQNSLPFQYILFLNHFLSCLFHLLKEVHLYSDWLLGQWEHVSTTMCGCSVGTRLDHLVLAARWKHFTITMCLDVIQASCSRHRCLLLFGLFCMSDLEALFSGHGIVKITNACMRGTY